MHKLFEFGDIGFGMLCGVLLAIDSLKLFNIEYISPLIPACLVIFSIFSLLNLVMNLKHMKQEHITKLAVAHGFVDIILALTIFAFLTNFQIPLLSSLLQFYENKNILLGIGCFFFITNLIWVFVE